MKSNESKFWEQIAAQGNPGWKMAIGPSMEAGEISLSGCDTYLYVVDTKTGWTSAGATQGECLHRAKRTYPEVMKLTQMTAAALASAAAGMIIHAARTGAAPDSEESIRAINGVAYALVDTKTFDVVQQRTGGVAGHWIYLVYTLRNGDLIGRPMYAMDVTTKFLDPGKLNDIVQQVIAADTGNPASVVGSQLASAGGAVLNESWS